MRKSLSFILLASASNLLLATPALAQQAADGADTPTPQDESAAVKDIVVTGSRIVRDGYTAPTPVTVATTDDLLKSTPSNIPDALNKLPQFQNSSSPSRSAHNFANTASHGNVLNLRGVGGLRTLILLDGQRVPATTYLGTVDVNIIPNLLVQRVDIVTGGASAAYGSDAVSGVVNFVLDRKFTGIKGVAQAGISERGDNANHRLALAAGFDFGGGRGHLLVSGESFKSDGMLRSARPLGNGGYSYAGTVTLAACQAAHAGATAAQCAPGAATGYNPYGIFSNVKLTAASEYGKITSGPFTGSRFTETGALVPFDNGLATGTSGYSVGGDGYAIASDTQAVAPLETKQLFGRASYDFSDTISGYVQGTFTRSDLQYTSLANSLVPPTGAILYSGNPYLPAAIQAGFTPTVQSITLARYGANSPKPVTNERTDFWMATAGLEGKFGDWRWSAAYNHGESKFTVAQKGVWDWRKFYAATDAVRDPSGNIVCNATLSSDATIRARYADCKPLNLLSSGTAYASQPGYAYATGTSMYEARTKQDSFAASIQGSLFELPAGPVDLAIGGEWRRQTLNLTTNADPALLDTAAERNDYFAGLRGVQPSALFYWLTNVGSARGKQTVKEVFGEIAIPLLKDTPFFQSLDLNAAGRYTDYSTSGSVKTWKLGATWKPINDILFRGALSRDIRAPNLFELFAGDQSAISLLADPVSGITSNVPQVSGGNPNLKPEKAKTLTFGTVLSPAFIPGLSVAVDYFRIKITGAIGTLSLAQIVANCQAGGASAPECGLVTRPSAAAFPTQIRVAPANIAFLETSGIDFDASYRTRLGDGDLNLRLYATYLDNFETQQSATAPVLDYAGITTATSTPEGRPKWRASLGVQYNIDGVGIAVTEQYLGKMTVGLPGQNNDGLARRIKPVFYTDLTLNYQIPAHGGDFEFFATVNNLFDKQPPLIPGTIPGVNIATNFSVYDIVGRAFTAGARFKF